jgi:hypothetical protein
MSKHSPKTFSARNFCLGLSFLPFLIDLNTGCAALFGLTMTYLDLTANNHEFSKYTAAMTIATTLLSIVYASLFPKLTLVPWAIQLLGFSLHSTNINYQIRLNLPDSSEKLNRVNSINFSS